MKKLLVLSIAVAILAVPSAFAGKSSGCGLGSILFEGQSGMVQNILAVTTNATSGSQTFGISTGTSNCNGNDTVRNRMEQESFVAVNMDNLSEEMAQGQGQYISALGDLMGCSPAAQMEFARLSQQRYEVLFSAPEMDAKAWLGGLKTELAKDATMASGCTRLS